ncbi:MAG: GNAT family N-acetyltransferase [Mesorhizobium sp. 61-13]|nr:MAG: GNAT family N-acetyltransferase [Mesorhizobium sp. 61-13]
MSIVEYRDLCGMEEFSAAERLQREVWGKGDKEDPADLMMVIQHEGGLAGGAFLEGRLIGYVFGFPTRDPGIQHSHRLAVLAAARGGGIGLGLKRYQRQWCLERGITLVRWTFDPLRHANAYLNIGRLGAEASVYYSDYYGTMGGINAGLPSDRLLAEWHIGSEHAVRRANDEQGPHAVCDRTGPRVTIPADFDTLLASDTGTAHAERLRIRDTLTRLFDDGYVIRDYDKAERTYLLSS